MQPIIGAHDTALIHAAGPHAELRIVTGSAHDYQAHRDTIEARACHWAPPERILWRWWLTGTILAVVCLIGWALAVTTAPATDMWHNAFTRPALFGCAIGVTILAVSAGIGLVCGARRERLQAEIDAWDSDAGTRGFLLPDRGGAWLPFTEEHTAVFEEVLEEVTPQVRDRVLAASARGDLSGARAQVSALVDGVRGVPEVGTGMRCGSGCPHPVTNTQNPYFEPTPHCQERTVDPIISPHDTAFIDGRDRTRATLVVVNGSAKDYLARQDEAQRAPRETARQERLYRSLATSGYCLALAVVAVLAWVMLTEPLTMGSMHLLLGFLGVVALPPVVLRWLITVSSSRKEREIAHQTKALDAQAHPIRFLVRNTQDAAVEFNERDRGLFEYVLETMTPQRCALIRELAETGEREVVRQALVTLACEYAPQHRQEQEAARAARAQAAQDLLGSPSGATQHPTSHRA